MLGALMQAEPQSKEWFRALNLVSDDELMAAPVDDLRSMFTSAYNADVPDSFCKRDIINALRGLIHSFWE